MKKIIELLNADIDNTNLGEFAVTPLKQLIHPSMRMNRVSSIDTQVFKITLTPDSSVADREGLSVYSLLKFGIHQSMKRIIVEKFLQLPIDRILQDRVISSLPPWNLFLVLDTYGNYDIL